jgi:hypothetical protein
VECKNRWEKDEKKKKLKVQAFRLIWFFWHKYILKSKNMSQNCVDTNQPIWTSAELILYQLWDCYRFVQKNRWIRQYKNLSQILL